MALDQEMNYNFYHVAQGSVLPRGGTSLVPTDSVYDIGSSTYPWDSVYVNSVHCSSTSYTGTNLLWTKLTDVYFSTGNATTTTTPHIRAEISGLNGDNHHELQIIARLNADTTQTTMKMYFNGDSVSANYDCLKLQNSLSTMYGTGSAEAPIMCDVNTSDLTNPSSYCMSFLNTKTGTYRRGNMIRLMNAHEGNVVPRTIIGNIVYKNSATTITSLVFEANTICAGSYVGIWTRG
jgi:hypothetical protein